MSEYSSFTVPFDYTISDTFIRAVWSSYIRRNGELKVGAFKGNPGVSVTRTNTELYKHAVSYMYSNYSGEMYEVAVMVCKAAYIETIHEPHRGINIHHWDLYKTANKDQLTEEQILCLIKHAKHCAKPQKITAV